jgi:SAM-dependent methyltransferase
MFQCMYRVNSVASRATRSDLPQNLISPTSARPSSIQNDGPRLSKMQEPPNKKLKQEGSTWYLFPSSQRYSEVDDDVFLRSKSSKDLGRRGIVVSVEKRITVRFEGGYEKEVQPKRLLPIYSTKQQVLLVTAETASYRNLASSQLTKADTVLEIGCSTGEASSILVKYCKTWMGFDTSDDMIKRCKSSLNNTDAKAYKVDALADPDRAQRLVVEGLEGPPSTVFIDIGGNRECEGVLRMIAWVLETFSPIMVVIKSRELAAKIQEDCSVAGDGLISDGTKWIKEKLDQLNRKIPSHPLKAPLRSVDKEKPICRYHNYHKDGCQRYKNGRCTFDHEHCHLCLEKGHIALRCPLVTE